MDKYSYGAKAEIAAKKYLQKKGYNIIDTNIAYKNAGELDIVAYDGNNLVIIEVRYRATSQYGHPLETLTKTKRQRIIRATGCYLAETKPKYSSLRFDIISVTDNGIEHIENAFYKGWN